MVVDDSVTVVIPDSEDDGEGEETLIFCPYGDINIETDSILPVQRLSQKGETPDGISEYPPEDGRRLLRRRKAIQRMPYSLERIKHKQLLEGYDVSRFESVSEEVRLPFGNPEEHPNLLLESSRRRDENDGYYHEEDFKLKPNVDDDSPIIEENLNEDDECYQEDGMVSDDEELLKFRGRLINMKTGFRGVLPKVAWKKCIKRHSSDNRNLKRRRAIESNCKGIAKKKNPIARKHANQDDTLLDDLIVPDDEVSLEEEGSLPPINADEEDLSELRRMDQQYRERYGCQYLSDTDDDVEEMGQLNNFIINLDGDQGKNQVEISSSFALTPQDSFNQYDDESDPIEISAVENDEGVIDKMLSEGLHKGRQKNSRSCISGLLRRVSDKKMKKRSIQKRYVRGSNSANNCRSEQHSRSLGLRRLISGSSDTKSQTKSTFTPRKNDDKDQHRKESFSFPATRTDNIKHINVFSTIMEAPSNKYAFPKRRVSENENPKSNSPPAVNANIPLKFHLTVLDALFKGKQLTPPATVSINLSNKQFILSRYHRDDVPSTLNSIFSLIIDDGVTDKILLEISESVTSFLLHFNHLGVLSKIVEFHKRFRSKVNQLRERAKPIHFYQIAVCQVMFLEVTKYSDISSASQINLTSHILNHIVSFFKLLSCCSDAIVASESTYLFESFDILSEIAQLLNKDDLWIKLQEQRFPPEICYYLVNTFPTKDPHWEILRVEQDYNSVRDSFIFIEYCKKRFDWQIDKTLMLHFDRLFKKRRYEDFVAESVSSAGIVLKPSQILASNTVFNKYLNLLQEMQLSNLVVERITPMGELSLDDSLNALANRINLLITMARVSHVNLEKRMEELIKPLLTAEYLSRRNHQFLRKSTQLILDGILSLADINRTKNLTFRGKILVMIFKSLFFEYREAPEGTWTNFLNQLIPIMEKSTKSKLIFCKKFYPCLILMSQKDVFIKDLVQMLQLYLKNLSLLGVTWAQGNILQIIKSKVCISANWIDYYCIVGRFLIKENVMSWWSFYMYNDVRSSLTNKFYFDCKVLQMCDTQSFELIKKTMFKTAADSILHVSSIWFRHFLVELMKKECPAIIYHGYNESNNSSLVKRFLSIINRLSYNDILLQFISDLQKCHQQKTLNVEFVTEMVEYLNAKFIDNIKDSHDFFSLKRGLGISDTETEKSAFRDAFKSQKDLISQACFLEWGLIHAHSNEEEMRRYMEKLESLFSFSVPEGSFRFFTRLILVHLQGHFLNLKRRLLIYLLHLVNEVLNRRHLQISTNEFLELCILHKILCSSNDILVDTIVDDDSKDRKILRTECLRFQFNVLRIADGFLEFELLAQMSRKFLSGCPWSDGMPCDRLLDAGLLNEIENIFRYNNLTSQLDHLYLFHDFDEREITSKISELIMDVPLQQL